MNRLKLQNRLCKNCTTKDQEVLELLLVLPFPDPIIEDETQVLKDCPLYEDLRRKLLPQTRNRSDFQKTLQRLETLEDSQQKWTIVDSQQKNKGLTKQVIDCPSRCMSVWNDVWWFFIVEFSIHYLWYWFFVRLGSFYCVFAFHVSWVLILILILDFIPRILSINLVSFSYFDLFISLNFSQAWKL
jgi:hypothetical protein